MASSTLDTQTGILLDEYLDGKEITVHSGQSYVLYQPRWSSDNHPWKSECGFRYSSAEVRVSS